VFRTITSLSAPSIIHDFLSSQIFPNPTPGIFQINYSLPTSETVNLSIVDIMGKDVLKIKSEREEPGAKEVKVDVGDFQNGPYFCRLQIGEKITIRSLLIAH
jgi:hypothetical protein